MTTRAGQPQPRKPTAERRKAKKPAARPTVLPVDAEDIAMARLQAKLRETESRQTLRRKSPVRSATKRTTVWLPTELRKRAESRAAQDEATLSELVRAAVEHYLRSH